MSGCKGSRCGYGLTNLRKEGSPRGPCVKRLATYLGLKIRGAFTGNGLPCRKNHVIVASVATSPPTFGNVAQMVERGLHTTQAIGSIPIISTNCFFGELFRALPRVNSSPKQQLGESMRLVLIGVGCMALGFSIVHFGLQASKTESANNEIPKLWEMQCERVGNADIQMRCHNHEIICYVGKRDFNRPFSCVRK